MKPISMIRAIKSGSLILCLLLLLNLVGYSREATTLYSIQNNSPWNSSLSWSKTINGTTSGLVPQSNDTIIVSKSIILNLDFTFSGNGRLIIQNSGLLRAENFNLIFSANSTCTIMGELKVNNISFNDNSILNIANNASVNVYNSLTSNNSNNTVNGKLQIIGQLSCESASNFSGSGTIESANYIGSGIIMGISPASIIPASSVITEFNWLGMSSEDWNDSNNWSNNSIPSSSSNIAILKVGNLCKINNNIECSKLIVNANSEIQVLPLTLLQVNNTLNVLPGGKFTLKNTREERSSLITNGAVIGKINAEYPVKGNSHDLISSPVKSAPSGIFLNMFLRAYNESNSQWGDYITPTNTPLNIMSGYELQSLNSESREFQGTPNSGSIVAAVSANGNGLNLTGNPYPCYIDWEDNSKSNWQRDNIASAIYYPDPSGSGNYAVYLPGDDALSVNNGSRFIKPMQGFFVKSNGQGSIVVKESSRKAYMSDSKISIKNNSIRFKLTSADGITDESVFRVKESASIAFDDEMDALKISGNAENASIYFTDMENNKLSINTIPAISSSTTVPVHVSCVTPGTYTISTQGTFDFEYRYPVLLKDKQLNTLINLRSDSSYTFQHSPTFNSNRFELVFVSPEGIESLGVEDLTLCQVGKSIHIEGTCNDMFDVQVYDLSGKILASKSGTPNNGIDIPVNTNSRIVLVKMTYGKASYTHKMLYNN